MNNPNLLDSDTLANLSIDELLNANIADIEEAAGFGVFPPGAYTLNIPFCGIKQLGTEDDPYSAIVVELAVVTCVELSKPDDVPPKEGTKSSLTFSGGKGVQWFRTQFGHLAPALGVERVQDLMDKLTGCTISCVVSNQTDKNDKTKKYLRVSEIQLA